MQVNEKFIKEVLPFSLEAKKDSVGEWFIGYGYRYGVYNGLVWTQEQANKQLQADIEKMIKLVYKHYPQELPRHKLYAIISLMFDVSYERLLQSEFFNALKTNNTQAIRTIFLSFAKEGRAVSAKKLRRRGIEFALFIN